MRSEMRRVDCSGGYAGDDGNLQVRVMAGHGLEKADLVGCAGAAASHDERHPAPILDAWRRAFGLGFLRHQKPLIEGACPSTSERAVEEPSAN